MTEFGFSAFLSGKNLQASFRYARLVTKMRYVWRIISPILFLAASIMFALFYPLLLLILLAGVFLLLTLSRQLNLYHMVMMLKQVARRIGALRNQIRTRVRLGSKDYKYGVSADADDELRHRSYGYVR